MTATAYTRTVEVVERAVEAEAGGREVHEVPTGERSGESWVIFTATGYCSRVKIDRWADGTVAITREGKGGSLRIDTAGARRHMVPVFVVRDDGMREPVAAFGDSPDAYPEITDLGWFTRTDQFTAQRWACDSLADVAVELAFLHLS